MKILYALLLLISFSAQAFVPYKAYTFEFNVKTVRMDWDKERKLFEALELIRQVFASDEFKEEVLNYRFHWRRRFHQNNGLSNLEIYNLILNGVEKRFPYKNNAMDVEIELYSDYSSNVLGYTWPRSKRIWMNKKYYNKHTPSELAGHLIHEWLHKLGFGHERERNELRRHSVPYAIGYIVRDLARKIE